MKRFIKAEKLANGLDQFIYDLDPYGYREKHDSRKDGLQNICADLLSGKVSILMQRLESAINEHSPNEEIAKQLMSQLKEYTVASRLFISVMNYKDNMDKLSDFPYIRKGSFAIVAQFAVGDKNEFEEYTGYLTVTHKMCEKWEMTHEELFNMAVENSKSLYPGEIKELNYYTEKESSQKEMFLQADGTAAPETYVLTNKVHFNGASTLFYQPELLDDLARKLEIEQLALLPTGSNELYIIAMEAGDDIADLVELKEKVDAVLSINTISDCIMAYHVRSHMVETYGGEDFSLYLTEETNEERNASEEDILYSCR